MVSAVFVFATFGKDRTITVVDECLETRSLCHAGIDILFEVIVIASADSGLRVSGKRDSFLFVETSGEFVGLDRIHAENSCGLLLKRDDVVELRTCLVDSFHFVFGNGSLCPGFQFVRQVVRKDAPHILTSEREQVAVIVLDCDGRHMIGLRSKLLYILFTTCHHRKKRHRSSGDGIRIHTRGESEGPRHVDVGEPVQPVFERRNSYRLVIALVMARIVEPTLDGVAHEVVENYSRDLTLEFEVLKEVAAHEHTLHGGVCCDDDLLALGKKIF